MRHRILFVDDDISLLDSFRRSLRGRYDMTLLSDPLKALEAVKSEEPFSVAVSDYRMPKMDGIQFLQEVQRIAPDTVRVILTGFAETQVAIDAVNEGHVFRFLTKPCSEATLCHVLDQGIEQYRLKTAEKVLLEKTLKGAVKLLTDLLSLLDPQAFGRASRLMRYAGETARQMGVKEIWEIETAALLSQIGSLVLPKEVLDKVYGEIPLRQEEITAAQNRYRIAAQLLDNIPRLEGVAELLACQEGSVPGQRLQSGREGSESLPDAAKILQAVLHFDFLETILKSKAKALAVLRKQFDLGYWRVLDALEQTLGDEAKYVVRTIGVQALKPQMILAEDLLSAQGQLLIPKGHEISQVMVGRLRTIAEQGRIQPLFKVLVPVDLDV